MQDQPAILGFRQDRVGARLIGVVNILRLREILDPSARFLWLSQPDGPYPDLTDPTEIFDAAFVAEVMTLTGAEPDLAGRESLTAAAPSMRIDSARGRLAAGAEWFSDAAFDMIKFQGEKPEAVAAQTARLVAGLPLSATLRAALDDALAAVGAAPGQTERTLTAIHVRRGDILDGDPWSYTSWPSKYVPDEFYQAFVAQTQGPVLAFSDTPAAVDHLARGEPRIVKIGDLLGQVGPLTIAQRDVLELLLMARCSRVGAPAYSAFSRAAHVLGGAEAAPLPTALPAPVRMAAYDALVRRAAGDPAGFFAPGDLAQSLHYAAAHAANTGQGGPLLDTHRDRAAFLARFPFVMGDLAALAVREKRPADAMALVAALRDNPRLRRHDEITADQITLLVEAGEAQAAREAGTAPGGGLRPRDLAARYLTELFTGRRADGIVMPRLGWTLLCRQGPLSSALMLSPGSVRRLADSRQDWTGGAQTLPVWMPLIGWVELIEMENLRARLIAWPPLAGKLGALAGTPLAEAEAAAAGTGPAPPLRRPDVELLGLAGSALILGNRLNRAMRLLEWLAGQAPADAGCRKRMADACFAAGNVKAGWRWLNEAHELAPDNALICLSAALRAPHETAQRWLDRAEALWPELPLTARVARRSG